MPPIANTNKPYWAELATEAELGSPRTYVGGVVLLQTLAEKREHGNRYLTLDTNTLWEIGEIPAGTPVAVAVQGPAVAYASVPTLPPPRIRVRTNIVRPGFTRSGTPANAYGSITISAEGIPPELLSQSQYTFQLELLRYVPKRRKLSSGVGYVAMPAGFYHPSTWVGGVTPTAIDGTRGGSPNGVPVDRPSQWPLTGFVQNQKLTLNVSDVLLPFFEIVNVEDYAGNNTNALVYFNGIKRNRSARGVLSYKRNPFLGVFKFRYAAYDQFGACMITGAYSDTVYARPQKWPTIVDPVNQFTKKRLIQPVPVIDPNTGVSCFEQLTISVGGRVAGRQF